MNVYGDLIIKFNFIIPDNIKLEDYQTLKNILPASVFNHKPDSSLKEYFLDDYNKKKYEKMENDFEPNQPPQCHQQ